MWDFPYYSNALTSANTPMTITIRLPVGTATTFGPGEELYQAVLSHRARMRLYQMLQAAPAPLPCTPRAARQKPALAGKKRLTMLGQSHRMGRSETDRPVYRET